LNSKRRGRAPRHNKENESEGKQGRVREVWKMKGKGKRYFWNGR